jgi:hypothetical protein
MTETLAIKTLYFRLISKLIIIIIIVVVLVKSISIIKIIISIKFELLLESLLALVLLLNEFLF